MEINFDEYVSFEERQEIVREVFKQHCLEKLKQDHERIFSNSAYDAVFNMVNDQFDGKAAEMVAKKTKEVIETLTTYTVFKTKDHWDKSESVGLKILNEALAENKGLLKEKVTKLIEAMDEDELTQTVIEQAREVIDVKLFGRNA